MKLALKALKQIDEAMPFPVAKLAIMEAEKALAQPEQKPEKIPESWATHGGLWIETLYKHQRGEK